MHFNPTENLVSLRRSEATEVILNRIASLALAMTLLVFCCDSSAQAATKTSDVKQGNDLYLKGNYDQSIEKYQDALKKDPESDIINFNLGTALYKKGKYSEGQTHLKKALLTDDPVLKQKTFYNLGNSFYQSGIAQEHKNVDEAIKQLTESLGHFESAVNLNKEDQDAKFNEELVKKELERLKQKKQQQQQQNQQSDKDQQNNDSQNQESQQNQSDSKNNQDQNQENQSQQNKNEEQSGSQNSQQQQQEQKQTQSGENQEDQKKQDPSQEQAGSSAEQEHDQQNQNKESKGSGEQDQTKSGEEKPVNSSGAMDARQLTDKESKMILENYEQNEAPKGMFQMKLQKGDARPVDKDW